MIHPGGYTHMPGLMPIHMCTCFSTHAVDQFMKSICVLCQCTVHNTVHVHTFVRAKCGWAFTGCDRTAPC